MTFQKASGLTGNKDCPGGGIGRHNGLKIRRYPKGAYGFDSRPGHQNFSAEPVENPAKVYKKANAVKGREHQMIAHRFYKDDTHWYLDAVMFCELKEYRRPISGGEDDWESFDDRSGVWDLDILGGYCEDLLEAYLSNGMQIKQLFIKEN